MQAVATEFNISETCYLTRIAESESLVSFINVASTPQFHLRWFTPVTEVPEINTRGASEFESGGEAQDGFYIELSCPTDTIVEFNSADSSQISRALNGAPIIDIKRAAIGEDLMVELASGKAGAELQPDIDAIAKLPTGGILVSGAAPPDSGFDYYCRFFFPKFGINEDPITGSAQCALAPYRSKKASPRGGIVHIHLDEQNQRILMRGKFVTVMEGCILV